MLANSTTGYGPLDNLLWYTIIPSSLNAGSLQFNGVYARSGPTIIGNTLYFGTSGGGTDTDASPHNLGGRVMALDIGSAQGPEWNLFADTTLTQPRLHLGPKLLMDQISGNVAQMPVLNPPLGTANVMAVTMPGGLAALSQQLTLVADANRLLEIDYNGNAVTDISGTRTNSVRGGQLSLFTGASNASGITNSGLNTGTEVQTRIPLARPSVAHPLSLSSYVVADTGNNRVIQVDRGGNVNYELHSVANDMGFLRPGDPVTLNAPTDVQTWTDFNPSGTATFSVTNGLVSPSVTYAAPNTPYIAFHYLVADAGNYRSIEVVDAYSLATGQPLQLTSSATGQAVSWQMQHEIVFVTRSQRQAGQNLVYRSIQEFWYSPLPTPYIVAAVANSRQAAVDITPGTPPSNTQPIGANGINVSTAGGSILIIQRDLTGVADGATQFVIDSMAYMDANNNVVSRQPFSAPTYLSVIPAPASSPTGLPDVLLADANGVYELAPVLDNNTSFKDMKVVWTMSNSDYQFLTGRPLKAACLQKLTQSDFYGSAFYPHYLITNRYNGPDSVPATFGLNPTGQQALQMPGQVHGEVAEVRSVDYYAGGYQAALGNAQATDIQLYLVKAGVPATNNLPYLTPNPNSAVVWISPNDVKNCSSTGAVGSFDSFQSPILRTLGTLSGGLTTQLFDQPTFANRLY